MDKKTRDTLIARILNTFRLVLKKQIATYLNGVDAVTISRNEDRERYEIKTDKVWHLPLTCDPKQFRIYNPQISEFIGKVKTLVDKGELSNEGGKKLVRFVKYADTAQKSTIIYVGRHSDEKNIRLLIDAYQKLLSQEGMCDKVHFLAIGAGYATTEIKHRFKENATVIGLVPNGLLPDIFNFVRLRHGFFASASDTETYGITHEESQRCGLPLVAMEKGTRQHFYIPGDMIGKHQLFVRLFASILRQKEHHQLTGLSSYLIGLLLSILLFEKILAIVSIYFLIVGDFFAGIVGISWGRKRIFRKSLEGSFACFVSCSLIGWILLASSFYWPVNIMLTVTGALTATVAEHLSSGIINDNLTVPLISGFAMTTVVALQ